MQKPKKRLKRANGEGSVYQLPDGRWVTVLPMRGDSRAKRQRKYLYGKTRKEVVRKKAEALKTIQSGVPLPYVQTTVSSLAERWLAAKRGAIKFKTFENYDGLLRNHILPRVGHVTVSALTPVDLTKLYSDLEDTALSPRSVGNVHRLLHNILHQAERWEMVARNVAALVDPPRYVARPITTLSPSEAKQFLDAAEGHRFEAVFKLAMTSGARLGELLGLSWRNVNLDQGTIRVQETLQRSENGHSLGTPKTSSSERTIPLTNIAIQALRYHKARQLEEQMKVGAAWADNDLVFTTSIGTPLNPNNFTRREFKPLAAKAGLPHTFRFHDLRHVMASLALAQGIPVTAVSQMLGHANPGVTMRVYAHAMPGSGVEVAKAMDAVLA